MISTTQHRNQQTGAWVRVRVRVWVPFRLVGYKFAPDDVRIRGEEFVPTTGQMTRQKCQNSTLLTIISQFRPSMSWLRLHQNKPALFTSNLCNVISFCGKQDQSIRIQVQANSLANISRSSNQPTNELVPSESHKPKFLPPCGFSLS